MKRSVTVAVAGVTAALSVLLLALGSVIWVLAYIMPLLCGILMIMIYQSAGAKTAWLVFAAVSVLSLILLNDKESVLLYVLFFGYYPPVRERIDRLRSPFLRGVLKLLLFNAGVVATELLCTYVLCVQFELFLGKWSAPVLLLAANLIFVIYERLLRLLTLLYVKKYKPRIDKYFK